MNTTEINKLLIIGVGLIGGSLALALRKAGVVGEIVGAGRRVANLDKAVELGVIDRYTLNFADEVDSSDMIVVATPVLSIDSIFEKLASCDYRNAIITDVGSVKALILQSAERHFDPDYSGFVPAHPIAGTEHSGVEAAFSDLFVNRRTIITPTDRANPKSVEKVRNMWQATGSTIHEMSVSDHDEILAASSHLPHLAAFGLVHYIANHDRNQACFELAASGFHDFTRIASSDPIMWRDICASNRDSVIRELNGYIAELQTISQRLSDNNVDKIQMTFTDAKAARDQFLSRFTR